MSVAILSDPPGDSVQAGRPPEPALAVHGVTVRFGGLTALADVTIDVMPGSIVGLVGPNGAGKSTLFAAISGLVRPVEGRVFIAGADVTALSTQARARRGLSRTFQHPELFMGMTVRDHLVLAHRAHYERRRCWSDLVNLRALFPSSKFEDEHVDGLLRVARTDGAGQDPGVGPAPGAGPPGGGRTCPGGQSQRRVVGRTPVGTRRAGDGQPPLGFRPRGLEQRRGPVAADGRT